jgi:hypothetical protein
VETSTAGSAAPRPPAPTAAEVHASCEAVRDKYLGWRTAQVQRVLERGYTQLEDDARRALDNAKAHFMEACTSVGWVVDPRCYDDPPGAMSEEETQRCRIITNDIAGKLMPPP